jgi:hypothetical protein
MPRSGGNYTLPNTISNGQALDATPVQGNFADIATALSASVAKDGQTLPTANLPMGGFKHTGVASASARTEYASAAQVQDGALCWLGSVSGADTITAAATPAITGYVAGQAFRFVAAGANTGAATLNVDGVAAADLTKRGAVALEAGDIPSGAVVTVVYDGTRFQLVAVAAATRRVVQIVEATPIVAPDSTTAGIPNDNTIPQISEGKALISATITPTSGTSRLRVHCHFVGSSGAAGAIVAALFQDSTANALAVSTETFQASNQPQILTLVHEFEAGTTSTTTLAVRYGPATSGTAYLNRTAANTQLYGGAVGCYLTITEYSPT